MTINEGLNNLVEFSHKYGSDPAFVLAGGGNTSFKTDEFLFIKGSGSSLSTIKAEQFVKMNRAALDDMWKKTYPIDEAEREAAVLSDAAPMTYAYYHEVKGGKTPAKASSYTPDEPAAPAPEPQAAPATRIGWKCKICGYVVEMDELPEDFQCPICKQGREMFERVEIPA